MCGAFPANRVSSVTMTPAELVDAGPDYEGGESLAETPAARAFGRGLLIGSLLLLAFFVYFNLILPRQLFSGAALTIGEAEALQNSVGIIDKAMKIEERKGHTVIREAVPNPPLPDPFEQTVTLTVQRTSGDNAVYRFRYALEAIPSIEAGDRMVRIYPLNRAGEELLRSLELSYVAPDSPLPE